MSYIGNAPISAAFLTDTFSGTGSQTAFTMTVAPANTSSIIVAITGVLQDPSTYSVSGTTLTFSAAPPSGTSNISVRYLGIPASGVTTTAYRTVTDFTATAGQTSFSVPSYTVGYIDVYRNGVRLVSTDFTATTGTTVVLANACTVGDAVVTESFLVSSVLNAIPNTNNAVTRANMPVGSVLQVVQTTTVASASSNSNSYASTGLSVSITPSSTTSRILLNCNFGWSCNTADFGYFAFGVNGTADANTLITAYNQSATNASNSLYFASLSYIYSPASSSAQTYTLQFRCGAAPSQSMYFNRRGIGGAEGLCTLTATEIAA